MKTLVIITLLLFAACSAKTLEKRATEPMVDVVVYKHDTLYLPGQVVYVDTFKRRCDSLVIVADTFAKQLLHARLVLSNVKYYLNICIKNPSQDKFLKGWIRRAVN